MAAMAKKNHSKTAVITGASAGIGLAAVQQFNAAGWKVIALDMKEPSTAFGDDTIFIDIDISNSESIRSVSKSLSSTLEDGLHVLVNNAAVQITGPLADFREEDWDRTMATNLRAPYLLAQAFLSSFAKGSAIVNVVSVHAIATSANIGAYAASKGGLLALTRSMAIEFAERDIRVNAVLPGAIDTGMLQASLKRGSGSQSENQKRLEEGILMGRLGRVQEIAKAIYFLADNTQSSYITGQSLVVDGGALARLSTE